KSANKFLFCLSLLTNFRIVALEAGMVNTSDKISATLDDGTASYRPLAISFKTSVRYSASCSCILLSQAGLLSFSTYCCSLSKAEIAYFALFAIGFLLSFLLLIAMFF